jgi:hypothetical protein
MFFANLLRCCPITGSAPSAGAESIIAAAPGNIVRILNEFTRAERFTINRKKTKEDEMSKSRIALILQCLPFLIPLNIYVIGDWMGCGIQALFFRYQQTTMSSSLIFLNREIGFVLTGIVTGKSALATVVWATGVFLIIIATLVVVSAVFTTRTDLIRKAAFFNLGGALLFMLSIVIQYGILLHGPAGIAVPLGIPVLLVIAFWQYRISTGPAGEESGVKPGEEN